MSLLGRFVAVNRRWCQALDRAFPAFFAFEDSFVYMKTRLAEALAREPRRILEVGGVDRPLLEKSPRYTYVGLDIESTPRCHEVYDAFLEQSVEAPIEGRYDLIVSKTLLEHVPDNAASFRAMSAALAPGGEMLHMIPMKNHPYSLILRAVGPRLQKALLRILHPRDADITGYPTWFDHCTVGGVRQLLESNDLQDVDIRVFYMATDYFRFFAPLYVVVFCFEKLCERLGWTTFAALVVASARARAEGAG